MSLPAAWKQVPLTGKYVGLDGAPIASGRLLFISDRQVVIGGTVIVPRVIEVVLTADGQVPAGTQLPTTDDPGLDVAGWTYTVQESWPGGRRGFKIVVPWTSTSIDMSTVLPAVGQAEAAQLLAVSAAQMTALQSGVAANTAGVASLDAQVDALHAPGGAGQVGFTQSGAGAVTRTVQAKAGETVSVKDFGATGSGTETLALQRACTAAVANGSMRVWIPFAAFTTADPTDCLGCQIIGADTVITGRLDNHSGVVNGRVQNQNQSDVVQAPSYAIDLLPKILWRNSATLDFIVQAKRTRGYLVCEFGKDLTTTSDSLASSSTDPTRRRMTKVQDAVWAGLYQHTYSAVSGAWSEVSKTAGSFANLIPAFNSSRALKYWSSSVSGAYIEFQTKPKNGAVVLALYSGTGSDAASTVTVNGGTPVAVSAVASVADTIKLVNVPCPGASDQDTVTIRFTKGANTNPVSVLGVHFCELRDWVGQQYDEFSYYRNTAIYSEYLFNNSSNDAVIQEYNSGVYGVAFHGGETGITSDWYADGVAVSPAVGGFFVGRAVELRTSADVSWASVGGGSVSVKSIWRFAAGMIAFENQFNGNVVAGEVFTHMFGTNEAFTEIVFPKKIDLSPLPTNSRTILGRTSKVILRNPTSGQRLISEMTLFNREQNRWGGAHVWKQVGNYHKLYYGPCLGGRFQMSDVCSTSVHTFE